MGRHLAIGDGDYGDGDCDDGDYGDGDTHGDDDGINGDGVDCFSCMGMSPQFVIMMLKIVMITERNNIIIKAVGNVR